MSSTLLSIKELSRLTVGQGVHVLFRLGLYRTKDRRLLEDVILRRYRDSASTSTSMGRGRILFVGVARYTRHYPRLFPAQTVITIDLDPSNAAYGAAHHIVDRIENLDVYFAPGSFSAIVMNGLVGYGLNDLDAVGRAVAVCHRHLAPQGELILSTDENRACHGRLGEVAALREGFSPLELPGLGTSAISQIPWRLRADHVFFFFQKKEKGLCEAGVRPGEN